MRGLPFRAINQIFEYAASITEYVHAYGAAPTALCITHALNYVIKGYANSGVRSEHAMAPLVVRYAHAYWIQVVTEKWQAIERKWLSIAEMLTNEDVPEPFESG